MAIEWPGTICSQSPTLAHYLIHAKHLASVDLFRCKYCLRHKIQPATTSEVERMQMLFEKHGKAEGYRIYLSSMPRIATLVLKLQSLWYTRKKVPDNRKFLRMVSQVLKGDIYYEHFSDSS